MYEMAVAVGEIGRMDLQIDATNTMNATMLWKKARSVEMHFSPTGHRTGGPLDLHLILMF
jgi:hypothetical protein